jgi:hypothetical protein
VATPETAGPVLVLGPMLRYVGETEATVWVETGQECEVEVLGRRARTFAVAGRHYGLVVLDGLVPGQEIEYRVTLDGAVRWPPPDGDFPPSVLRTLGAARPVRLAFGSCRVTEVAPGNLGRGEEAGADALTATAAVLARTSRERWPDLLLMIGDQVYADEPGPATREFITRHRAGRRTGDAGAAPPDQVADFAEYCALYQEAWRDPAVRWLFSVLPTAMIFDDHDVHDDWNTSASWRRDFAAQPWWPARIESAFQSYWIYQHLGNLSPAELAADETWAAVRRCAAKTGDGAGPLADLARRADQRAPGVRWSFRRTFGPDDERGRVRLVVLDSRSRRVLDSGPRLLADEAEWDWLAESVSGDWGHVVIASSVPPLLPRGVHALEAWSERLGAGTWGRRGERLGERLRRDFDLEHWPAFGASFTRLERLLGRLATGQLSPRGEPPASVTVISGDIHHSYLARVRLPRSARAGGQDRVSAVYEAVCSPFQQAMPPAIRFAQRLAATRLSGLAASAIARLAGARLPGISWRVTAGPWFANMIATLEFDRRVARVRFDRATADADGTPALRTAAESRLS